MIGAGTEDGLRDIDEVRISFHAQDRFRERWELLYGSSLLREDVIPGLRYLLSLAKQTADNSDRWVCGPWRFVIKGNSLITVLVGSEPDPNLVLQKDEIRCTFYVQMIERPDGTLLLERSMSKGFQEIEEVYLEGAVKAKAVILFLHLLGLQVTYYANQSEDGSRTIFTKIAFPREIRRYAVHQASSHVDLIAVGGDIFRLVGVSVGNRKLLKAFVADEQWLARVEQAREEKSRREEKARIPREHELFLQVQEEAQRQRIREERKATKSRPKPLLVRWGKKPGGRKADTKASKWTRQQQWQNIRGTAAILKKERER